MNKNRKFELNPLLSRYHTMNMLLVFETLEPSGATGAAARSANEGLLEEFKHNSTTWQACEKQYDRLAELQGELYEAEQILEDARMQFTDPLDDDPEQLALIRKTLNEHHDLVPRLREEIETISKAAEEKHSAADREYRLLCSDRQREAMFEAKAARDAAAAKLAAAVQGELNELAAAVQKLNEVMAQSATQIKLPPLEVHVMAAREEAPPLLRRPVSAVAGGF